MAAGVMIGRALELAAQKKTPLMIYVFTDGGVSASTANDVGGIFPWGGDSGQRSAAFSLVYTPGGSRTPIRNNLRQIGAFTKIV